jgi:hypothetical protein
MLPSEMTMVDLTAEMRRIGQELLTQDNRITSHPVVEVRDRHRIYDVDVDVADGSILLDEDNRECDDQLDQIWCECEERLEDDEDGLKGLAAAKALGELPPGVRRVGYRDVWETVQVFFTVKAAEEYIVNFRHNLEKPHTYISSGWRNQEWQLIREYLMRLCSEGV